ncbi:MAG: acetolactate synthase [Phycisphaerales bacterium]|nr:acetolactate synthase [Phycisphaerales bacterium]
MDTTPFETAFAAGYPTVRQLSIFFENRVGELLRLTRLFERTDVHILGLSVVNSVDCAIIRMIVDKPDAAYDLLRESGFAVCQTDILVVSLPGGKRALLHTWIAFLSAEVSVAYAYALLGSMRGQAALAVQADGLEHAAHMLQEKGFTVLDQTDLATLF